MAIQKFWEMWCQLNTAKTASGLWMNYKITRHQLITSERVLHDILHYAHWCSMKQSSDMLKAITKWIHTFSEQHLCKPVYICTVPIPQLAVSISNSNNQNLNTNLIFSMGMILTLFLWNDETNEWVAFYINNGSNTMLPSSSSARCVQTSRKVAVLPSSRMTESVRIIIHLVLHY